MFDINDFKDYLDDKGKPKKFKRNTRKICLNCLVDPNDPHPGDVGIAKVQNRNDVQVPEDLWDLIIDTHISAGRYN